MDWFGLIKEFGIFTDGSVFGCVVDFGDRQQGCTSKVDLLFGNRGSLSAAEFGGIDAILMATGGAVSPTSNSTVPPNENKNKTPQPLDRTAPTSNGGVSGAEILNGAPPPAITIRPTTPRLDPNATGQTLVPQPTRRQFGNREA